MAAGSVGLRARATLFRKGLFVVLNGCELLLVWMRAPLSLKSFGLGIPFEKAALGSTGGVGLGRAMSSLSRTGLLVLLNRCELLSV